MLYKAKSRKTAILKYGLSAPLFAAMVILSSATLEKSKVIKELKSKVQKELRTLASSSPDTLVQHESEALSEKTLGSTVKHLVGIHSDSLKFQKAPINKLQFHVVADDSIRLVDSNILRLYGNPKVTSNRTDPPLVFIDGVQVREGKTRVLNKENNVLSSLITPKEVYWIEILKDQASIKKYGDKGKHGVIEVTTKEYAKMHPQATNIATVPKHFNVKGLSFTPTLSENSLYIINEKEISHEEFKLIAKEKFESMMVLWGEHAAKYGEKGKNGVFVGSTKAKVNGYSAQATSEKQGFMIMSADRSKVDKIIHQNTAYFLNEKRITKAEWEKLDQDKVKSIEIIKDKKEFGNREIPAGTETLFLITTKE